jgi:flagellar protein FlgJ
MNPTAAQPNIFDGSNLAALKRLTKQNDPVAIKQSAQQFEALFVQMMMKSMRDATPRDEAMGSDQQRMYESLLDQQLSQVMATRGGGTGLAAMIEKQMTQKQPDLDAVANSLPQGIPLTPASRAFSVVPTAPRGFALPAAK